MNKFKRCEDEERCCRPEGADTGKPAFVVFSEDVADESTRRRRASTADLDPSPTEILQIPVYTTWTAEGRLIFSVRSMSEAGFTGQRCPVALRK
ncbi:hypothetical protein MRX96_016771 [Rhipicephalus microplus]